MKTASQEVRLIAIRAYRSGISRQQTADIAGYHLNSVSRWIREFEQDGRMEARPRGHRISVFTDEELFEAIGKALSPVSGRDAQGWFQACGCIQN